MNTTNDGGPAVHPMVIKAARVLNRRTAQCCNTDEEDSWRVYGPDFIADAQVALTGCGALDCLQGLEYAVSQVPEFGTVPGIKSTLEKVYGSAPE